MMRIGKEMNLKMLKVKYKNFFFLTSRRKEQGFTLMELLIVVALLGILLVVLLWAYPAQIGKANDAKRKEDLDKLRIALQEYYSDKHCFPTTLECGQSFSPYLDVIPCDPNGSSYIYLPQTADCAQWFKIYTNLQEKSDPVIKLVGCDKGCGPDKKSNYGVSSTNVAVGEPSASAPPSPSPSPECSTRTGCFAKQCNSIVSQEYKCPTVYFCDDNCSGGCWDCPAGGCSEEVGVDGLPINSFAIAEKQCR
jgi:prepilin-type N-terminal cleavage/methylation domain-containing protein